MSFKLSLDDGFFTSIVERLWKNSPEALKELVENSYDGDAGKVLITFVPADGTVAIEDNAGMDAGRFSRFLQVGGLHEEGEERTTSGRKVVGKYRFGRFASLGVFKFMRVRTRRGDFSACLEFSEDDLRRLASGAPELPILGLPPLGRDGTEIVLSSPKTTLDFEGVHKSLGQLPILRTPGFEVYMKKADELGEWDLEGAKRLLPREISGLRVLMHHTLPGGDRVEGVITIADDRALPLAAEDRGVGVVVSSHLVLRTYFGFESSPHRIDRLTGFFECDSLKTTFGSKDQLIEDDVYAAFWEASRAFIQDEVVPKLAQVEAFRIGRMEAKSLGNVTRRLDSALTELPLELFKPESIPTKVLRLIASKEKLVKQQRDVSSIVLTGEAAPPQEPSPPGKENKEEEGSPREPLLLAAPSASPTYGGVDLTVGPSQAPNVGEGGHAGGAASTPPPAGEAPGQQEQQQQQPPGQPPRKRVAHYLRLKNRGIFVLFYDDAGDPRPSYSDKQFAVEDVRVRAVFINREHPSYKKCSSEGGKALDDHLLRLITNELVGMNFEGSEVAMEMANRLYSIAVVKK